MGIPCEDGCYKNDKQIAVGQGNILPVKNASIFKFDTCVGCKRCVARGGFNLGDIAFKAGSYATWRLVVLTIFTIMSYGLSDNK